MKESQDSGGAKSSIATYQKLGQIRNKDVSHIRRLYLYRDVVPEELQPLYDDIAGSGVTPRVAAAACTYLYGRFNEERWCTQEDVAARFHCSDVSLRNRANPVKDRAFDMLRGNHAE